MYIVYIYKYMYSSNTYMYMCKVGSECSDLLHEGS